ncbi:MAG TPA: lytic transglycosylase domain-containing protein [Candidatus Tumulicola sp.]|nr:lytic transglycosylase domain-containing protein [Candidatus Tumulicola sp.]
MNRVAAIVLCSAALLCGLAPARADDDVTLYHRSVAAGGSDAIASTGRTAMHFHVSSAYAMRIYVQAIRYFNPGIDEAEAQQIVYAIVSEARSAGIDPRLVVAIVATESAFDRTARSSAGALGLGQLMPSTAAADGVGDTSDISQNIHGTVLTLKGNLEHYAGLDPQRQYEFAIAAYNAGTGAVDRYNGVPPYDETINYVTKVIALWRRFYGKSSS